MAFIFGPAIARGDISSLGLYTPFVFGFLLGRVVKQYKKKIKLRGWPQKVPTEQYNNWMLKCAMEVSFVFAFLAGCHFLKTETRSLFNFFLSSFVCPMLRFCIPWRNKGPLWNGTALWDTTWGETSVHILMIGGLIISWLLQGIDHIFLGFLFLQAVPEIQRRFWMKPLQHVYLIVTILTVCFPFYSIGVCAWYFPSYLEMLPKPYLQTLCWFANAKPSVPDHYLTLGVSPDADMKTIKKIFREQAIELHPDKVGDDPVKLARFHAIQTASDALTKGRAEYDKSIENQELNEMVPRCYAFLVMMGYWLLHSLIDWNEVEGMRDTHKDALRNHVMRDGPVDFTAIGLPNDDNGRATLKQYCEPEDVELPFLSGKKADIIEMRKLLEMTGYQLQPFPQVTGTIENCMQEIVLGTKDSLNLKEVNTTPGFYKEFEIEITQTVDGKTFSGVSTIVDYQGGDKRVATIQPALKFEIEQGEAKFTISRKGYKPISGTVGFHSFNGLHQVFTIGLPVKDEQYAWQLHDEEGFYNGYTFEVKNGKTLVGYQRVYEYWPQTRKVILDGALRLPTGKQLVGMSMKDANIMPVAGESTYTMYPDDLIPRPRRRMMEGGGGQKAAPQVAATVMATPKNIVGAPKGSVAAGRNIKSKINKQKAYVKKQKSGGSSCAVM